MVTINKEKSPPRRMSGLISSSPPRRRGSKIDADLLAAPEHQELVFESILARRDGSVLARDTILKSDHFGTSRHAGIDLQLSGAPNFRQANLNVFGVAQPTIHGLATVLRLLRCGPHRECLPEQSCTWFSTREEPLIYINSRPFVLRDRDSPFENIRSYAGISATRIEQMELRLKADIAEEASRNNGLLLVHDETEDRQQRIAPCLTAIDSIKTSAEVFAEMQESGFCVNYRRVPVSNEQSPLDAFIDELVRSFQEMPASKHVVVFSCGIGVGRTTYAMVIGMILRRSILLKETGVDPFGLDHFVSDEEKTTKAVLRLVSVLEQGLQGSNEARRSAVEWTLARSSMIDNLKAAILGNYHVITELVRVLDHGAICKRIVDEAIDKCEALLNIRDHILINRVNHSVNEESSALDTGIGYLERYFSLVAFCAFIGCASPGESFASWIQDRRDIWNMLHNFRRQTDKLCFFRPVEDLSELSARQRNVTATIEEEAGGMAEYNVIKSRAGTVLSAHTILKIDHWNPIGRLRTILAGAPNFRQLPDMAIYASAQPTLIALKAIVGMLYEQLGPNEYMCWINVREEPLVYIADEPYVLRDRYASLRNIKSYTGITADRLEQMETRLKEDVLSEASTYNQRVLVHFESTSEKTISPSWVSLNGTDDVLTLSEIFTSLNNTFPRLVYRRIPVTAEEPMEPVHFDEIMSTVLLNPPGKCHMVINCQMGASRSTLGAVIAGLVHLWAIGANRSQQEPSSGNKTVTHYRIIHSILRVIKDGPRAKAIVDELVDAAAAVVNMRECIGGYHKTAEQSSDPNSSRQALRKGIAALKRYAMLILFQGYLFDIGPYSSEIFESFTSWLGRHMEFTMLLDDLDRKGIRMEVLNEEVAATPSPGEGPAQSSQVLEVVLHRRGQVLAPMTILKFDHFPGCQKLSLPERVVGAPNFRQVTLDGSHSVYGLAMPTKIGFVRALERIKRPVRWFCLREEPLIYVNGRPYVLRIVKDPISNLEMTGIISERVELMEERLKADTLAELILFNGKLLLHEEDGATGQIVPVWEAVKPEDVETTAEIVESIKSCGYKVEYSRIPITDEQAPIPSVFDHLLSLVWESSADPIYNCQMGRGRTTTGMVIAVILHLVRNQHLLPEPPSDRDEDDEDDEFTEELSKMAISSTSSARYLAGEYKLILSMQKVLEHGKLAKRIADHAIDQCSHIQNLRTAIFDYKKLPDPGERGLNYLLRYCFLIVFTNYLVELGEDQLSNVSISPKVSFVDWLGERKEIVNMVHRRELLDFS